MAKLFDKGIYCIGTVRIDRKNMAVMKKDNTMKRGDIGGVDVLDQRTLLTSWIENHLVGVIT